MWFSEILARKAWFFCPRTRVENFPNLFEIKKFPLNSTKVLKNMIFETSSNLRNLTVICVQKQFLTSTKILKNMIFETSSDLRNLTVICVQKQFLTHYLFFNSISSSKSTNRNDMLENPLLLYARVSLQATYC